LLLSHGVSGCPNKFMDAMMIDFGIMGTPKGFTVYVGETAGLTLASAVTEQGLPGRSHDILVYFLPVEVFLLSLSGVIVQVILNVLTDFFSRFVDPKVALA